MRVSVTPEVEWSERDSVESSNELSIRSLIGVSIMSLNGVSISSLGRACIKSLRGTAYDEVSTVYIADATNARVWCYDVTQNLFPGYIYDPIFKTHPPYGIVADENLVIVSCGTTLLALDIA